MVFGMAVLDLVETVVERLVADRGAGLARLEAFAMELVVRDTVQRKPRVELGAVPGRR